MTHDLFPSGPWTGFYNYSPKDKHRIALDLAIHRRHVKTAWKTNLPSVLRHAIF